MHTINDNGRLIVLNKDEHTVSFLKIDTGETLAKLDMDKDPHEVIVTRDGATSYVTNAVGKTVAVIDNGSMRLREKLTHPEFDFPHGIDIDADGTHLWLASTVANKLFVISIPDHRFVTVIPTGQRFSHMIAFTPDRKKLYVPNIMSNTLTLVDATSHEIVKHVLVGKGPEGVAVHPSGDFIYVAAQHEDLVQVFSTSTHEMIAREAVGSLPVRMAFTPDGRYAFVPNRYSKDVSILDCSSHSEIKRIPIGIWPGGVVFGAEGRYAFVANNKTNDVSVIDVASLSEVARHPAGIHPDGIAYIPA